MRTIAAAVFVVLVFSAPAAAAKGDNSGASSQSGSSSSGDAVGGPSISVARAGDVRVVATNVSGANGVGAHSATITPGSVVSTNVQGPSSAQSGDASGSNEATTFVGAFASPATITDVG